MLAWQRRVRAAGDPSTAAGAYQIIHATLQELFGRLRIDPAARFTPALQDRLARARNAGRAFNVRTPGAMPAGSRSRSADSIPGRFGDMMAAGDPAGATSAPSRVPAPARDIVRVRARNEAKTLAAAMAGTPTGGAWPAGIAAFAPGLMAGRLSAAGLIAGFFHDHVPLWFAFVPLFAAVAARRRAVRAFAMAACMAWPALLIAAGLAALGHRPGKSANQSM